MDEAGRPPRRLGAAANNGAFAPTAVLDRMRSIAPGLSFHALERRTGINHETIRRYFMTGKPSLRFIIQFCKAFDVSADWLITGVGVTRLSSLRAALTAIRNGKPVQVAAPRRRGLRTAKPRRRRATR